MSQTQTKRQDYQIHPPGQFLGLVTANISRLQFVHFSIDNDVRDKYYRDLEITNREVYRIVRLSNRDDRESWKFRLSECKQTSLKMLLQHKRFTQCFDSLL